MPNWIMLTADDIKLLDTEITIMSSITPVQSIDTCVLNAEQYARGYVSGGGNVLEPAPAVPPECVDDVIALARATYLAQEPTGTLLTKVRQDERTNAIAHLRDIAADKVRITPADPTLVLIPGKVGTWSSQLAIQMRTDSGQVPP